MFIITNHHWKRDFGRHTLRAMNAPPGPPAPTPPRPFAPPPPHALTRPRPLAPPRSFALLALCLAACAPAASSRSAPPRPGLAEAPRPDGGRAEAAAQRARALALRGDFDAAEGLLRAAVEEARGARDDRAIARLQAELADSQGQAYFYRNSGDEAALRLAAEAQQNAARAGERGAQAQAIEAEGMVRYGRLFWRGSKDFSEPRAVFERALALRQAAGDAGGASRVIFHLGLTYEQEGKGSQARRLYERALSLAEGAGDKSAMAYALRHLGGFYEEDGDLERALAFHRRCLALREEIGALRLVPYSLLSVGDLEVKQGDFARARATYERALATAEQAKSAPALIGSHQRLGDLDEREGRHPSALARYQLALARAEALSDFEGIAAAAGAAARVHRALGDTKRSHELTEQAERARARASGG